MAVPRILRCSDMGKRACATPSSRALFRVKPLFRFRSMNPPMTYVVPSSMVDNSFSLSAVRYTMDAPSVDPSSFIASAIVPSRRITCQLSKPPIILRSSLPKSSPLETPVNVNRNGFVVLQLRSYTNFN
ncbi:hypothetical protein BE221DRAFT_194897 [Ostreococcus tauri]|uniref:Uncharacterized protein n=1 Tax=Ostreococcus tauri TaxID=70448 RepID=A0A1Y5I1S9_OSTTA|nr:hypothetical protein BE221DRAFT_194897 [Ostreococcus tauri]